MVIPLVCDRIFDTIIAQFGEVFNWFGDILAGQEDSMLRYAPRQVCFANVAPVHRLAVSGSFDQATYETEKARRCCDGLSLFGRGRRIRTRDPRFWSGKKCSQGLENARFFARFNPFSSQDRVSHLCLKILDAFLIL